MAKLGFFLFSFFFLFLIGWQRGCYSMSGLAGDQMHDIFPARHLFSSLGTEMGKERERGQCVHAVWFGEISLARWLLDDGE